MESSAMPEGTVWHLAQRFSMNRSRPRWIWSDLVSSGVTVWVSAENGIGVYGVSLFDQKTRRKASPEAGGVYSATRAFAPLLSRTVFP
jgi:hypothetical protein